MNQSSDAAEQIVRMSLQGFEVGARITGSGAKEVAALLLAVMKDKKKTAGKTKLVNMLKSGKELKGLYKQCSLACLSNAIASSFPVNSRWDLFIYLDFFDGCLAFLNTLDDFFWCFLEGRFF